MLSTIIHTKRTQHSRQILCIICSSCTCICVLTTRVLPYFYFTVGVGRSMYVRCGELASTCANKVSLDHYPTACIHPICYMLPYSFYTSYLLSAEVFTPPPMVSPQTARHPTQNGWASLLRLVRHISPKIESGRGHKRRPALVRNACAHSAARTALLTPALWLHPVCAQAPRPTPARLRAALHRIPAR